MIICAVIYPYMQNLFLFNGVIQILCTQKHLKAYYLNLVVY